MRLGSCPPHPLLSSPCDGGGEGGSSRGSAMARAGPSTRPASRSAPPPLHGGARGPGAQSGKSRSSAPRRARNSRSGSSMSRPTPPSSATARHRGQKGRPAPGTGFRAFHPGVRLVIWCPCPDMLPAQYAVLLSLPSVIHCSTSCCLLSLLPAQSAAQLFTPCPHPSLAPDP